MREFLVRVLDGVHVRAHEGRDLDLVWAVGFALTALLAELGLGGEGFVGEECFLFVGVGEAARDSEVLVELVEGGEAGDGGGDVLVAKDPLEERRLALGGQVARELLVGIAGAAGLRLHGDKADAFLRGGGDGVEVGLLVRHRVVDGDERYVVDAGLGDLVEDFVR